MAELDALAEAEAAPDVESVAEAVAEAELPAGVIPVPGFDPPGSEAAGLEAAALEATAELEPAAGFVHATAPPVCP